MCLSSFFILSCLKLWSIFLFTFLEGLICKSHAISLREEFFGSHYKTFTLFTRLVPGWRNALDHSPAERSICVQALTSCLQMKFLHKSPSS